MLGTQMKMTVCWQDGAIVMNQETTRSGKTTTATITQRYNAETDRIVSENDSIE